MLKLKIKILKTAAQDNNTVVSKFLYQEISDTYVATEFSICFSL